MSHLFSSWLSSANVLLRRAASGLTLGTIVFLGCEVPDSVEVSRSADGKVNVTSTHVDVTVNERAADAETTSSPLEEETAAETSTPAEPVSATEAETAAPTDRLAAADSEEKPARVFSSSRAPARPGEAEKISFDDLVIGLQADVVFRPWMMGDRPKELDGKKVRISGFMHAGAEPVKTKEFVLLRNLECKFGPGGQADHLAQVYMKPGITTNYPGKDPIKVEGTLKIEPFEGTDGNTWSLYKIVDSEVVR